ncbi:MAG: membrane protein insertase YidC [Deltaproteobacteria bacterium]|nr:membrane protein insertase YidC [Deltaproteobacteria bacterium]
MDKRTLMAVVLALAVYYLWMTWVSANEVPVVAPDPVAQTVPSVAASTGVAPVASAPVASAAIEALPLVTVPYSACGIDAELWSGGGALRGTTLADHLGHYEVQPLWSWLVGKVMGEPGSWLPYGPTPDNVRIVSSEGHLLEMGAGPLDGQAPRVAIEGQGSDRTLRGVTDQGIEVIRTLKPVQVGDHCLIEVEASWRNLGAAPWSGDLWISGHDQLPESNSRYAPAARPVALYGGEFEEFTKLDKLTGPEPREGSVSWFGLADGYFASVLVVPEGSDGRAVFLPRGQGDGVSYGVDLVHTRTLAPGERFDETYQLYIGPKSLSGLKDIRPDLSELVRLGFFGFFAKILLIALTFFHGLLGNWGWAIIALTVVVKLLFYPLTQVSFKSSQAMQDIQPELTRIKEQLKDKPEELNRRTMELFKENGVNPLGGCLPMLVQMPVWFALYAALLSSVDLYHTEFYYLRDLSVADPYMVLPAVVVALMMVQQQFVPMGNMDPVQAKMMKFMPLMFGFFFFAFPAGLVLYIFVNTVLTITQQWLIKRQYGNRKEPAAQRA